MPVPRVPGQPCARARPPSPTRRPDEREFAHDEDPEVGASHGLAEARPIRNRRWNTPKIPSAPIANTLTSTRMPYGVSRLPSGPMRIPAFTRPEIATTMKQIRARSSSARDRRDRPDSSCLLTQDEREQSAEPNGRERDVQVDRGGRRRVAGGVAGVALQRHRDERQDRHDGQQRDRGLVGGNEEDDSQRSGDQCRQEPRLPRADSP